MTDCPVEEVWAAWRAGRLSEQDAAALFKHCDSCQNCQRIFDRIGEYTNIRVQPPGSVEALASTGQPLVPWTPPQTFAEFRIRKLLGQGAMGQVFIAQDMVLDRPVAVKFITSVGVVEKERFLVEARAIARLNHPNVVTLYRVGELDGRPYLVSELIAGESLDRLSLPIPWERALDIGKDLAAGLAEAHSHGVVHRDVKPANVILSKNGVVKLLDFGLARLSHSPAQERHRQSQSITPPHPLALTQPGSILGTPLYMSPEAWTGKEPIPQMDVYSLGALLYELCTGDPPHLANELPVLGLKVLTKDIVPIESKVPGLDPALAHVVDRCLQRDPAARYPSGVELHQELQAISQAIRDPRRLPFSDAPTLFVHKDPARAAAGPPAADRPLPAAPARVVARPIPAEPARAAAQPPLRKDRRWLLLSGLLMVSLVLSALVLWQWRQAAGLPGMVLLGGGEFMMGSSNEEVEEARAFCEHTVGADCKAEFYQREPQRQVRLSPFYLDATEVTNQQFAHWLNRLPGRQITDNRLIYDSQQVLLADLYPSNSSGLNVQDGRIAPIVGRESMPVVQVTWDAALRYCQDRGKQLPTEAQWEFAARGKDGHRFPWGDGEPRCDGVVFGRKTGRECGNVDPGVGAVGTSGQDRSSQGIYDLGGNVSEWVMDLFRTPYPTCRSACVDPLVNIPLRNERVLRGVRGGNWLMPAEGCRAAGRSRALPAQPQGNIGFRCALPAK